MSTENRYIKIEYSRSDITGLINRPVQVESFRTPTADDMKAVNWPIPFQRKLITGRSLHVQPFPGGTFVSIPKDNQPFPGGFIKKGVVKSCEIEDFNLFLGGRVKIRVSFTSEPENKNRP